MKPFNKIDRSERSRYLYGQIEELDAAIDNIHNTMPVNQDLSGKVDKITAHSLVADTEISKIHASGSDNQDLSGLQPKEADKGLYPDVDSLKLAGIDSGANNYTHPENHAPSVISQDISNRFVTDSEKAAWNAKSDLLTSGLAKITVGLTEPVAPGIGDLWISTA